MRWLCLSPEVTPSLPAVLLGLQAVQLCAELGQLPPQRRRFADGQPGRLKLRVAEACRAEAQHQQAAREAQVCRRRSADGIQQPRLHGVDSELAELRPRARSCQRTTPHPAIWRSGIAVNAALHLRCLSLSRAKIIRWRHHEPCLSIAESRRQRARRLRLHVGRRVVVITGHWVHLLAAIIAKVLWARMTHGEKHAKLGMADLPSFIRMQSARGSLHCILNTY